MKLLLDWARQILETAAASDEGSRSVLICLLHNGSMRVIEDGHGWSLPALAAEAGARAAFRMERRPGAVRVEAWSPEGSCALRRDLEKQVPLAPHLLLLAAGGVVCCRDSKSSFCAAM